MEFQSFRELLFLHINNTMVILLKIVSVWVSFIKSCKLESKTRANVFGKVYTMETYQCNFARVEGLLVLCATFVAPKPQELLLLYLAATNQVVSAALVAQREVDEAKSEQRLVESERDKDNNEHNNESNPKDAARKKVVQRPVYFVSSLLQGARSRYSGMQKLIFGLIMASRKLRHYFQAHEITVVTHFPL